MKELWQKIRFIAMVIADDISIVASMYFRKGKDPEIAGQEV